MAIDLRIIFGGEPGRADNHMPALRQRGEGMRLDGAGLGVVDHHIGRHLQGFLQRGADRNSEEGEPRGLARILARRAAADRAREHEIVRGGDRRHESPADPAGRARQGDPN
jgi:hypothetical protein